MKVYLGDSVYVDVQNGMLKLTTENGLRGNASNTIYLEPAVFDALKRYVAARLEASPGNHPGVS